MTARPDLAALDVARLATVPAEELPAWLATIAAEQARLAALEAIVAARLIAPVVAVSNGQHDVLTDVRDVADIVRRSVSWVRKNGHNLPGFRQPSGKGTRVAWARTALEAWATGAS